ncbi:alpha/beta fold hydrolase [Pengzhenrongella sicca]|uniref:Alpha/beta fold hydrolase n=1 Tax=Pengzhenrongella sicca TaxID=2819238 RepID=A0A8A4ZF34_9MICO|nr:alpha/beta hydrolase [Pengzhenrongella sicca]QTE30610.1 alpha/beta fold hydrolase [Pengzhenrongella sicca]
MPETSSPVRPPASPDRRARLRAAPVRLAFGLLDRVAPPLAARWALDIWCTLPNNSGRRRDERPAGGVVTELAGPGRTRLAIETWGSGPPVYLVHGWGGWRGQLGAFVEPLVAAGHRVIGFDAPGHGDSAPGVLGSRRGNAAEFARALSDVVDAHGPAAGVIAHSLGSATAALAVHDGAPVARLAVIAPSPDFIRMTQALPVHLGYGAQTHQRFLAQLAALAERPLADFDMTTLDVGATPALIVHDRLDKEVPYADSARLADAWPRAEFVTTEGLGHQRILQDPAVVERVCRFVAAAA